MNITVAVAFFALLYILTVTFIKASQELNEICHAKNCERA